MATFKKKRERNETKMCTWMWHTTDWITHTLYPFLAPSYIWTKIENQIQHRSKLCLSLSHSLYIYIWSAILFVAVHSLRLTLKLSHTHHADNNPHSSYLDFVIKQHTHNPPNPSRWCCYVSMTGTNIKLRDNALRRANHRGLFISLFFIFPLPLEINDTTNNHPTNNQSEQHPHKMDPKKKKEEKKMIKKSIQKKMMKKIKQISFESQ